MSTPMFEKPDAPGRDPDSPQFSTEQHVGSLLVLQVKGTQETETEYGVRPVVVADVHVIDAARGTVTESFPDAWLFGTVLQSQLRGKVGRSVLGVLELGEKRPGRKPPYRLGDATPQQTEAAVRALTGGPAPAAEEPAPQPAAVGAAVRAPWETTEPPF